MNSDSCHVPQPTGKPGRRPISKQQLVADFLSQALCDTPPREAMLVRHYMAHGKFAYRTMLRMFGSWSNLTNQFGSQFELLHELHQLTQRHRQTVDAVLFFTETRHNRSDVNKAFGSWGGLVETYLLLTQPPVWKHTTLPLNE